MDSRKTRRNLSTAAGVRFRLSLSARWLRLSAGSGCGPGGFREHDARLLTGGGVDVVVAEEDLGRGLIGGTVLGHIVSTDVDGRGGGFLYHLDGRGLAVGAAHAVGLTFGSLDDQVDAAVVGEGLVQLEGEGLALADDGGAGRVLHAEQLYLEKAVGVEKLNKLRYRDSIPLDMKFTGEELQRFRDSLTEGYNITPNFFIRNGVPDGEINYSDPQLKANDKLKEDIQKQFEDRLFDRDTLLLLEYYINLFFVMRAYATDEDWSDELHKIIREDLIKNLNRKYSFWRIYPKENPVPFVWIHFHEIIGKAYRTELFSDDIILAFEKTKEGEAHKAAIERSIKDDIIGEMKQFDLEP